MEKVTSDKDFWKNKDNVKIIVKKKKLYEDIVSSYEESKKEAEDIKELLSLGAEENDQNLLKDCSFKINNIFENIKKNEIKCFLSGENDNLDIYLEIHAGAGGTESQDWAEMIQRMYQKWFDKKLFKYEIISMHKGDEAGIKSSTLKVTGNYLYGLMKKESGVHRLVRISPFDSGARRHTSFASVWVYPAVNDDIDIKVDEKDLRIDTYRSSGAGGQHVNTTDSAVRITHLPSKIVLMKLKKEKKNQKKIQAQKQT